MKQVGLAGGIGPPSVAAPSIEKGDQTAGEVGLIVVVEVTPTFLPLFWQRGRGTMLLDRLAVKSQRTL